MAYTYSIHPSIGIARVGNSPDQFYLAPETIGGLPLECDAQGNIANDGASHFVQQFKDSSGRIKRQAARFKIFRYDDANPNAPGTEVTLADADIAQIEWTVHLANKKAVWYEFSELEGDLMLGPKNSYQARHVARRNAHVTGETERQKLIIDPGPRTLNEPGQSVTFSRDNIPPAYTFGSFPKEPSQGLPINTLGELRTDDQGRLLVLGAFGNAGGDQPIDSFAGGDTWHDDIADGPVNCRLQLKNGTTVDLDAWVIVGSPKFAPELVNIVTLDDIAFDVGVRYLNLIPELYANGRWNCEYVVNYKRDIEPIIRRPLDYTWVSNVPSMVAFAAPPFDLKDVSEANRNQRQAFFSYYRRPGAGPQSQHDQLWSDPQQETGIPLMPLQSGSNSVSNQVIDKFLTLTETQYFMLSQWADGKFSTEEAIKPLPGIHPLDQASLGNCVGGPMCPGIEVTWNTRNPPLYAQPYRILPRFDQKHYFESGLSTMHDECEGGGCEPGDLTKRMATPWQADFFQCTAQFVNFTDANVNKDKNKIPVPPTYYAYWWPPQSPMYVISGPSTVEEQAAVGVPAGFQVYYPRGINSFAQMITGWSYLGFIVNQNTAADGRSYPYFAEKERNNDKFYVSSVAVGDVGNFVSAEDTTFWPMWFLKPESDHTPTSLLGVPGARRRVHAPFRGNMRQHDDNN